MAKRNSKATTGLQEERVTRASKTFNSIASATFILDGINESMRASIMEGGATCIPGREEVRESYRNLYLLKELFGSILNDTAQGYTDEEIRFRTMVRLEAREAKLSPEAEQVVLNRVSKNGVYPESQDA